MKEYINKVIVTMLLGVVFIGGCEKDIYHFYDDDNRIQFGPEVSFRYNDWAQLLDTLKRATFYYEEENTIRDTVYFDIYTIGKTSGRDRGFKLIQEEVKGVENAVSGVHYVPFESGEMAEHYVIKAGDTHRRVPVILLRDPSLKKKEVLLKLAVEENENFKQGILTNVWRKIYFTDKLSRPMAWDDWISKYMYGNYSLKKHEFMIEVTGKPWNQEFFEEIKPVSSTMDYWRVVLRKAIAHYNNTHKDPKVDEFGNLITF